MAKIIANTVEMKRKAEELRNTNRTFKGKVDDLCNYENALNGMWDGEANDAFHNAFRIDSIQLNNFFNAIERYVQVLNDIVAKYDAIEAKNRQKAADRSY